MVGTLGASPGDSPWRAEVAEVAAHARAEGLERDDLAALFTAVLDDLYPPKEANAVPSQQH